MNLADQINQALSEDKIVMISVYNGCTEYRRKNSGQFFMGKDGHLYVKRGKRNDCYLTGTYQIKVYKKLT